MTGRRSSTLPIRALVCLSMVAWLVSAGTAAAQVPVRIAEPEIVGGEMLLALTGPATEEILVEKQEVVLRYAQPITPEGVDAAARVGATWIETIAYGYDSLVIRFAADVEITVDGTGGIVIIEGKREIAEPGKTAAGETTTAQRTAPSTAPGPNPPDPEETRLEFYRALTLIESGEVREGRALLVEANRRDPRNIEVILLLAQAEERLGRPMRAIALYDEALALDPALPAAIRDKRRLHREVADTARIRTRWQDVANGETQLITAIDGRAVSGMGWLLDYMLENRDVDTGSLNRPNGDVSAFDGSRQRGSVTLTMPRDLMGTFSASLYGSNHVVGAGLRWEQRDGDQSWALDGRVSEPAYTFLEGIVEGGARDRAEASWRRTLGRLYDLSARLSVNRYTLDGDHAGASAGGAAEIRRIIHAPLPFATIGYRFEADYVLNSQESDLTRNELLPLSSTETHTIDASLEGYLTDYLRARGSAGYTYDRLNGGGPTAEASLIYEPLVDLEIIVSVGTSLTSSRGTDNQLTYGELSVRTRF